jgi:rhomboid family GlyGly-CTERM serine protease
MNDRRRSLWFQSLNCDGHYGRALLLTLGALAIPGLGGESWRTALQYDRGQLGAGEWWRLLGAHWVHLGAMHLLFNLAGVALLWALFARCYAPRQWLWIVLAAMLAVDAGLWFMVPGVVWYAGASGALHGVWSAGGWAQWHWRQPRTAIPLLLLIAKLSYEQLSGTSAVISSIPVVLSAHLYGALGGLLLPLLWSVSLARRNRSL